MNTTRVPMHICSCGQRLDAASGPSNRQPKAGSISICFNCGEISLFNADLSRTPATLESFPESVRADIQAIRKRIVTRKPS